MCQSVWVSAAAHGDWKEVGAGSPGATVTGGFVSQATSVLETESGFRGRETLLMTELPV